MDFIFARPLRAVFLCFLLASPILSAGCSGSGTGKGENPEDAAATIDEAKSVDDTSAE